METTNSTTPFGTNEYDYDVPVQEATLINPTVNPFDLVFHVDLFLCALVALFALATLPRAISRFSRIAEWKNGHILWNSDIEVRTRRREPQHVSEKTAGEGGGRGGTTEESHTLNSHTHLVRHPHAKEEGWTLPPHVQAWSSRVPPLARVLRYRLDSGFSLGQALVLGVYFLAVVYMSFYKSNPFGDALRTGFVAMSQIPLVYVLGAKNNVVGWVTAVGYEKLNYIHRFAGFMIVLASNVHALGYFYQWTLNGTLHKWIKEPSNIWAIVALVSLDICYFFSTPFWRRKAYNIFFNTHVLGFVLFLPAAYGHQASMLPYILAAAGALALDHLFRLLKTRLCHARIRALPTLCGGATRIELPALNAGWRAGQHVRVRVFSSALGWFGWCEVHPFTIACAAKTPEGLVLVCKKEGGWTGRLYEMAVVAGYGGEEGHERGVRIAVEGPYGGPGHAIFASYSAAIFFVGGSGITFALAAVQDLIQRDCEGASRLKLIEIIWSIQDASSLTPLIPQLTALVQQSIYTPLHIAVHYTRAASSLPAEPDHPEPINTPARSRKGSKVGLALGLGTRTRSRSRTRTGSRPSPTGTAPPPITRDGSGSKSSSSSSPKKDFLPPGLSLSAGRPRLGRTLDAAIQRTTAYASGVKGALDITGVVVGVCGPVGMADEAARVIGAVDPSRRWAVGGVEMHEETFGW
ncbi:hypothetical protein CONPUDRAFT_85161 [Coniophora puteana RWD-64-598 SS2]|uniref:ferric-chelate reductase (NADPH) n=1 Tax=Coniophora puteana (strain RWD-64-598) TaxID=741705 RepID=A0A5M3MAE8_CONPW|nr:uncharacterized protein CONPUDRAFT_85161 [Coniophora puteana RWD-64-598 SS2]EIW75936.1 hypothetical protein CONPUDRAFT_85161 [Coniophora puteana RWD-64-598 SS2]